MNGRVCESGVTLFSINVINVVYLLPPTSHIVARRPGYFMRCGGRWKCNYFPTDPLPLSTFARYRESRYANRNCYNTSTLYISGFVDSLSSKQLTFRYRIKWEFRGGDDTQRNTMKYTPYWRKGIKKYTYNICRSK